MGNIVSGSKWCSAEGTVFVVIQTAEIENKNWVHYRLMYQKPHLPEEFSCYEESFLSRFRQLPE